MSERIGICEQCGQRFGGIPESVTALKVKCTECGGVVVIPPLPEAPVAAVSEAPAAPAPPSPAEAAKPTPPPTEPAKDKPLAAPLGDTKAKPGNRPDSAKPVDREVAAVKKPAPPKKVAKPIVPLKPVAKVTKPIQPLKPVAKPAKPIVPVRKPIAPIKPVKPAAKPAAPVKPVAKPAAPAKPVAPKPVAKKPAPPAPKPKPAPVTPPPAAKKAEPAKPSAADIIAKAKAKKAAEAKTESAVKPSAADIIAKAKAKRSSEPAPAGEKKASAADIVAKAKAKREAAAAGSAKPASGPGGRTVKVATAGGAPKVAAGGARKRPAGGGSARSTSRKRRPQEEEYEEKSKAPLFIFGAIVLIGAGIGAWALMKGDSEPVNTTEEVVNVPAENNGTPASAANNSAPAATDDTAANDSTDSSTPAAEESGANESSEVANGDPTPEAAKPAPVAKASSEFTLPAAGERINTKGVTDPALILLDQVTPLGKASDTSEDIWKEAVEDLALYLEDSGASSNRAGNRLAEDYPRAAYPAIINAMMKVDYTSAEGMYTAAALNNLLLRIGTRDLSWKPTEFLEPGTAEWDSAVAFDKKVVAAWHNLWVDTYANSVPAWNLFSKIPTEGGAVEEADTGGIVGPDDDLFD